MWVDPEIPEDMALIGLHWEDGAVLSVPHLSSLLEVAQEQAEAYAPALDDLAPVPESYRLAVIFQARELRRVQITAGDSSADVIGVGDYVIRARPLSGAVKAILRPPRPPRHFGRRRTATP